MSEPLYSDAKRPRRRRNIQRKVPDNTVPSPCISVCMIDEQSGFCQGCLRNIDEIRDWMIMDREEKLAVLDRLPNRTLGSS